MQWKNLKSGLCPKCSEKLTAYGIFDPVYWCSSQLCDFKMGEEAYKRTIDSMNKSLKDKEYTEE